jgi:hypothetical protein
MRKILFNDKYSLTQEVLAGNKTMTRRSFARFEPDARMFDEIYNIEGGFDDKGRWIFTLYNENGDIIGDLIPHYKVGDIVAIAQSYKTIYAEMEDKDAAEQFKKEYENTAGWNNKMFVKADLLPHHIRITDIKIERLQDISEEDALREGIEEFCFDYFLPNDYSKPFLMPRDAFAFLIDKVGKKGDWDKNPLVAAYTFELVD